MLAVGLGKNRDDWPADVIRRAAGVAARSLNGTEAVITTLSDIDLEAAIEGLILGAYRFSDFRSDKTAPKDTGLREITALTDGQEAPRPRRSGRPTSRPPSPPRATSSTLRPVHLYPDEFAKRAKALGEAAGLEVEVLDDKALVKAGYGGMIGVGKGSSRPPRLVRLTHKGAKNKKAKKVALVGKGITFDTGGISIKPAANMHHMTSDMGGAAAVIATVVLAAKQKLPIDVIATVPMAENMPSSTAQRPGDVLTQYGGITVEVLNTDAEGRLILADAIVRACEDDPDYLIETSTLTGAQTVALGARTPGVMGTDEFRDRVAEALAGGRRERLGDAASRGTEGRPEVDGGRPRQRQRFALRGHAGRGRLPSRVRRRRGAVGAHRHRGARLQHRRPMGLHRQGRHRGADPHDVRGARGHRPERLDEFLARRAAQDLRRKPGRAVEQVRLRGDGRIGLFFLTAETIAFATLSGPWRRSRNDLCNCSRRFSTLSSDRPGTSKRVFSRILVSVVPGQIVVSPTPASSSSARRQSENMYTAALDVQ